MAGKRNGLKGKRSGLFHEQMRIFNAARHICGARYLLWENVPGAFSSNKGRDFAVVVGKMAGCGIDVPSNGWRNSGVALGKNGMCEWCVLDAQYFGVPQRRRRVFAFLDTGNWQDRPPILFDAKSLQRHPAPRREAGQSDTYDVAPSLTASGRGTARTGESRGQDCLIPEVANPLTARMAKGINTTMDEGQTPIVEAIPIHDQETRFSGKRGNRQDGKGNGIGVGQPGDMCPTLTSGDRHAVAFQAKASASNSMNPSTVAPSLDVGKAGGVSVNHGMVVRRLVPKECERLQGFPDDYTNIEKASDTARYKALGNSMAVPVMKWIGEQIESSNEQSNPTKV